jgi:hypothetical protein
MWFSYVGSTPLCFFAGFMAHLRQLSRAAVNIPPEQWRVHALTDFGSRAKKQCKHIFNDLKGVRVQGSQLRPAPVLPIYSDASTEAIAGIARQDDAFVCILSEHSAKGAATVINQEELLGGLLAALILAKPGEPYDWRTDNTSAKHALLKGHSSSNIMDRILRLWLRHAPVPSTITWVPSKNKAHPTQQGCMRADGLTRFDTFVSSLDELARCTSSCSHEARCVPLWLTPSSTSSATL